MRSVVFPLIGINILVYILQTSLGAWFTENLMLVSSDVLIRPWMLFTSMFLHGSTTHLAFNMLGLLIFGPLLESLIRPRRFLTIYLAGGVFASLVSLFFYDAALGASGAVMAMIGTLIYLMPNLRILLFFIIPMPLWIAGVLWAFIDVAGFFFDNNIANAAHLAGMALGLAYAYNLKGNKNKGRNFFNKKDWNEKDVDEYLKNI